MEHVAKEFPSNLHFRTIKVYLVEISLALKYLHSRKIVYRDLKLENILIGDDNHIRLIDFGLAEQLKEKQMLNETCGTAQYLAPEMILQKSYTFSVDWWSLGILAYNLLLGGYPFEGETNSDIFQNIISQSPQFPSTLGMDERDFIESLLNKNPFMQLSFE
jgi:serine/threonine protein kinase